MAPIKSQSPPVKSRNLLNHNVSYKTQCNPISLRHAGSALVDMLLTYASDHACYFRIIPTLRQMAICRRGSGSCRTSTGSSSGGGDYVLLVISVGKDESRILFLGDTHVEANVGRLHDVARSRVELNGWARHVLLDTNESHAVSRATGIEDK